MLKNILPVTLGNAFAGAILVACSYSLAYGALGRRLSGGNACAPGAGGRDYELQW